MLSNIPNKVGKESTLDEKQEWKVFARKQQDSAVKKLK